MNLNSDEPVAMASGTPEPENRMQALQRTRDYLINIANLADVRIFGSLPEALHYTTSRIADIS